jgi:hypothetical protein
VLMFRFPDSDQSPWAEHMSGDRDPEFEYAYFQRCSP